MGERRIVTKVEYDTTGVAQGAAAGKAALSSFGETSAQTAAKNRQSISSMEREYKRLVGAIDPADKAQQRYARAVDVTTRLVEKGRITQQEANETLKKAETFYSSQAASIRSLADVFDKAGGKTAIFAGKVFALVESFKAGWEMGERLRGKLNELMPGFDDAAQRAWGFKAAGEALAGVQDEAAAAADRFRADLVVLRRYGIEPMGLSAVEAAARVNQLRGVLSLRQRKDEAADALFPKPEEIAKRAEAITRAWNKLQVEIRERRGKDVITARDDVSEEARLRIAKLGAQLLKDIRESPNPPAQWAREGLIPLLQSMEKYIDSIEEAKRRAREQAEAGKRNAREHAAAWERAHEEAIAAEARALDESRRLAEKRAKDLAEGLAEAHKLAAERSKRIWSEAMDDIAAGVEPIRRALDEVSRLDLDLDFSRRVGAIDAPTERLRAIERQYLEFLRSIGEGSVEAGEAAFTRLAQILGFTVDDIKAKLGELSDMEQRARDLDQIEQIRGSSRSSSDLYRQEVDELRRLRGVAVAEARRKGEDTLEIERDFAAREGQIHGDRWNAILGEANSALGFLADRFGGFFSYLQQAVEGLQQAGGFGQSVGNIAGAMGAQGSVGSGGFGGTGGMGAAAGVASAVYVWWMVYDTASKLLKDKKTRNYGTGLEYQLTDFSEGLTRLDKQSFELVKSIRGAVREFEDALRISVEDLAEIGIKIRNDGKYIKAYVSGQLIGKFRDVDEAINEALRIALTDPNTTLRGLSDLMRQGLEGFSVPDGEELLDFLQQLRQISDLGLSQGVIQLQETERQMDRLWRTLEQMGTATPAVVQGFESISAAQANAWRDYTDRLMGRTRSPEEQLAALRREGELAQAQLRMRIADLRLREAELRMDAERLRGRAGIVRAGGEIGEQEIDLGRQSLKARGELLKADLELQASYLSAADAALEAIGKLIAELENIEREFDPDQIKLPRVGDGRGGGDPTGGLAQMIADSERQRAMAGKSAYINSFEEINRKWNEAIAKEAPAANAIEKAKRARDAAIKAANGNAEAIDRANAAYSRQVRNINLTREEIDRANAAREAELELVRRQQHEATRQATVDYVRGPNVFDEERKRAADLRKQWKDLLDTGAIKWRQYKAEMDKVNEALEEHIRLLGLQESSTLFGQLAGMLQQAGLGDSAEALQLIAEQQRANWVLQLAEAQLRYAQLKAEGVLVGANLALVEGALARLAGIDPANLFTPQPAGGGGAQDSFTAWREQAQQEMERDREEAERLRDRYASAGDDGLSRRLREISNDFDQIFRVLGRGEENLSLFRQAVDDAFDELRGPVEDWLASLNLSENSPLTGQQREDLAAQQFDAIAARIAAGDFSAYRELAGAGDRLLEIVGANRGTAGEYYQQLLARIMGVGNQAVSLADAAAANYTATGQLGYGNVSPMSLPTAPIVDAVAAGNASALRSANTLAELKTTTDQQAFYISNMAADIRGLRVAQESINRELSMLRNSRAS